MAQYAVSGELVLQQCADCSTVQYPPREVCSACLSDKLEWQAQSTAGHVLATSQLHHSLEPVFQENLPWTLTSVKLDCGPVILAQLPAGPLPPETPVCVTATDTGNDNWILQASPTEKEITR
jgi:uncharacterized OB-fold protein